MTTTASLPITSSNRTRRLSLYAALLVLLSGCANSSSPVCEAPHVSVSPTIGAPGGEITLSGSGFFNGCADNGIDDQDSNRGLSIVLVAGGEETKLAQVDAIRGEFRVDVVIPSSVDDQRVEINVGGLVSVEIPLR